jgi:hypothetical protein
MGVMVADKEVQKERINICKACDKLTSIKICKECGCFMPLKVTLEKAKCPLNKWIKIV